MVKGEIRVAVGGDIPALVDLGYAMQQESPRFAHLAYAPVKVAQTLQQMIAADNGRVFVAVRDDIVVGMMGGYVLEYFFSHDKFATDLYVYVAPPYRGGSFFTRLVVAFEQWAIALDANEIVVGISTEVEAERTASLYERLGYRRIQGITLMKKVK